MVELQKVEIVIESIQMRRVMRVLERCDLSGFTVVPNVIGSGSHGLRDAEELSDVSKNNYIFTVCTKEQAEALIEAIRPIVEKCSGICLVSTVYKVASSCN